MDVQKFKQELGLPAQITLVFVFLAHPAVLQQFGTLLQNMGVLAKGPTDKVALHLYMFFAVIFFVVIWLLKKYNLLVEPCHQHQQ